MERSLSSWLVGILMTLLFTSLRTIGSESAAEQKHSAMKHYFIDMALVVDDVVESKWIARETEGTYSEKRERVATKLKEYVSLLIQQANLRFGTLAKHNVDFTVQINIAELLLGKIVISDRQVNFLTRRVNASLALLTARTWAQFNNLTRDFDHVMLLTGQDLQSTYEGSTIGYTQGRASIASMCNTTGGYSVSVVEEKGGFQSVYYVAHELAHSLGSRHDGEPPGTSCRQTDRYIMASGPAPVTPENKDHPWYFSMCSALEMQDYLNRISEDKTMRACLVDSTASEVELPSTEVVPGQVYTARAQCQMLYGQGSTVCLGQEFSELKDICTSMYCLSGRTEAGLQCREHYAAEGTSCGSGQWCRLGRCVTSSEAPVYEERACAFGDSVIRIQGYTCSEYTREFPALCYDPKVNVACCESCANVRSNSELCPYGDKVLGCRLEDCNLTFPNGTLYAELCCDTCHYDAQPPCHDVSSLDGLPCEERVYEGGLQGCYNLTVAYHCCSTCTRLRRDVEGCEYGDLTIGSTCHILMGRNRAGCATSRWAQQCCLTCDANATLDADPDAASRDGTASLLVIVITTLFVVLCSHVV